VFRRLREEAPLYQLVAHDLTCGTPVVAACFLKACRQRRVRRTVIVWPIPQKLVNGVIDIMATASS